MNTNNNESSEADDKQRVQYKRIAMRMIKSIIKSMPSLAPSLKLDKKVLMVNNQVYMPLFTTPPNQPRWQGNLKGYLLSMQTLGLVGLDGNPAFIPNGDFIA